MIILMHKIRANRMIIGGCTGQSSIVRKIKKDPEGTVEQRVFSLTQRLIQLRFFFEVVADFKNIDWMACQNRSVLRYERYIGKKRVYFVFDFSNDEQLLT